MLDPNAVTAAIALTQAISAKGITLVPVPDTAVALLVKEMPTNTIDAEQTDFSAAAKILVDLSRGEAHVGVLTTVVNNSSDSVRRTLAYSRNVVMPHVYSVIKNYTDAMNNNLNAPMPYKLQRVGQHDALKTNVARDFLDRWEGAPMVTPVTGANLGHYEPSEILDLVKISDTDGYNEHIESLLTDDGGKGLSEIAAVLKGEREIHNLDTQYQLPAAIVLHAISENPKPGVGMTLSAYKAAVSSMANHAAKKASGSLNAMQDERNNQSLYHGIYNTDAETIPVVDEVYTDLLDKGFTIDMLFGNELLGRKFRGPQMLDPAAMQEMTEAYNRDRMVRQQAHSQNRQQQSRQALLDALRDDQKRIAESGEFPVADDSAEKSWLRLKGFIDSVTQNNAWHHYEPSSLIAATICVVWYAHSDAFRIIDNMFELEKTHKGVPPSELSTLASMQYISEWVADQVGIGKFSEGEVHELLSVQAG